MTARITQGTDSDLPLLEPLWLGMFRHHDAVLEGQVPFLSEEESWTRRQAKYARWIQEPEAFVLLARPEGASHDAAPTGYVFCRVLPQTDSSTADFTPSLGAVESLSVAPEARGSGVGGALLAAARSRFVAAECSHWQIGVMEANVRAAALYERIGFKPWERHLIAPLQDPTTRGLAGR